MLAALFALCAGRAAAQPPDTLSMAQFMEEALERKEDVWVVDLWASWCGPCLAATGRLRDLKADYAPRGVRFVGVSLDRSREAWLATVRKFELDWTHVYWQRDRDLYFNVFMDEQFPAKALPAYFVVDREGRTRRARNLDQLEKKLKRALR